MKREKTLFSAGIILVVLFALWTYLIQAVDLQPIGVNGTEIGFGTLNGWFHELTGVHLAVYELTDILEIAALLVCVFFGFVGLIQLIKRKSLLKVDRDIVFLGIYYIVVIAGYVIFEIMAINFRPVLIEGAMEASYPSSTTLLVVSVMLGLILQINLRVGNAAARRILNAATMVYTVFMVIARLTCGVHWFTDVIGGIMLGTGLFLIYKAVVLKCCEAEPRK